jgi:uncharacterized protein (TIGR02301 family)
MRRLPLLIACAASLVLADAAQAQQAQGGGIWDFFRRRPRQEEAPPQPSPPRPPAPPRAKPPAPPAPPRAKAAAPTAPAATAPAAAAAAAAQPAKPAEPAPYEKDMQRLGEIMGALHYLRPLCGAEDGAVWRDKMNELMAAEGGPIERRERLAGAFNSGYSGFQLTYRTCTPSAKVVVERYLTEGAKLSRDISTRHGT